MLTSLPLDTRQNLQTLLQQYGQGAQAGRPVVQPVDPVLAAGLQVLLDRRPRCCSASSPTTSRTGSTQGGTVDGAIDAHPQNLQSLVTDFNTTAARSRARASPSSRRSPSCRARWPAIPAFNALNNAFPPVRRFARALTPGVVSSGPAIDASLPFIAQLRQLVQPSELRGLTADLAVTVPALAKLTRGRSR